MPIDENNKKKSACPFMGSLSTEPNIDIDIGFDVIFEHSLDGIIVINSLGIVERLNPAAENIFGYSRNELLGQNISILMPSPLREEHDDYLARYNSTGQSKIIGRDRDIYALKKDGLEIPVELAVSEIKGEEKHYFLGTIKDITIRKQQERELNESNTKLELRVHERTAELELANKILETEIQQKEQAQVITAASLREKEIFLKEIHHRVKNNLQLIISILNLHKAKAKDKHGLQTVLEIQERIYAIAHLHETLYQSGDFGRIQVDKYIRRLVGHLIQSANEGKEISINYDIEPISLSLDDSLPCGLVVNEVVLNCLKHAFLDIKLPQIDITLKRNYQREVTISVKDNGIGFPSNFLLDSVDSVGMHLVKKLTEKLGATLSVNNNSGAEVKVTFLPEGEDI